MADYYSALYDTIEDKNRIIVGKAIEDKYLSDVLGHKKGYAQAVVFPTSTAEVSEIMKYAYQNGIPITPRDAGTNLVGSTVPLEGGIVPDLSQMNRVIEIDCDTLTATVEPGVLLGEFQSLVESKGLFYPPDPGDKEASIGGNISTNAGGMRAVKYGVTRDYVRGLELVLANGDIITVGSKNVKEPLIYSAVHLRHIFSRLLLAEKLDVHPVHLAFFAIAGKKICTESVPPH